MGCFFSKAQDAPFKVLDSAYLFESGKTSSIIEILNSDSLFRPLSYFADSIKKTHFLNFWTKVQITMNTPGSDLAYRTVALWVDEVEIFQYDLTGNIYKQQAGLFMKNQAGGILSGPFIIFRIPYSTGKITFYQHHIQSEARPGSVISGLYETVVKENNFFYSVSWFIITALLIVFLLALLLFLTSGYRLYLFYALHVLCVGLFSLMDFGIIIKILGFRPRYLYYLNMYTIAFMGSILALMFYTRIFFNTRKKMPWADKIILILIGCRIALFALGNATGHSSWFVKFNSTYWDMPLIGFAFIVGVFSILEKQRYAWLFSCSFFVLLLSVVLPHLWMRQVVQINLTYLSLVLLETLLFFIAIMFRIKMLSNERESALLQTIKLKDTLIVQMQEYDQLKDKINLELEQKVVERTQEIVHKNEQIELMNSLLQQHNIELKGDVENLEKARILQQSISFEEFKKTYADDKACYTFLSGLKWPSDYLCKKCANTRYSIHDENERRKCSKCNYIESPTTDTFFHNVKFPIHKAFYLLYLFSTGKSPSLEQLSKELNLRMATIWTFKQRADTLISKNKSFKKNNGGWIRLIPTAKK